MQAGKLRHRVEIQVRETTQDSFGDALLDWRTIATVWAQVEEESGSEKWQATSQRADAARSVTIRYRPGIIPRHRLLLSGFRVLNIESVTDAEGRRRELKLSCREEV